MIVLALRIHADPPDLLALVETESDGEIVTVRDQVCVLAVGPQARRGIRMLVLIGAIALALGLPDLGAIFRVDGDHLTAAVVDELHVEPVAVQHWRTVKAEGDAEFAVALLD